MITRVAIGTDHRGFALKEFLKQNVVIEGLEIAWLDLGAYNDQRSDYPVFSESVCQAILAGTVERGILLCATGVGMAIAANRHPGIYAAVAWNVDVARMSVEDDKANILVLPSDYITNSEAIAIVIAHLTAQFRGGRYQERITMIDRIR